MEWLRLVHDFQIVGFPIPLFPTPVALATLILFLWSIAPAVKGVVRVGFLVWLRITWAAFLIPAVIGVILALGGLKVPSATDAGSGVSKYGYPVDPSRDAEHWMYAAFTLLTLYVIEVLVKGRMIEHRVGLKYLPLATLFLYGCAYMIGRVAVFPGSTPGT
ncbi:hypothetical protein [Deinococcus sp.]|uniref:hypothetical protein n=1 Tax=Deinococcus sp. TaxID=47478 RepID=UPI002869DDEF|nr:hypothetical protein [Deinococcus sp.]